MLPKTDPLSIAQFWFPSRWIGGTALIIGPLCLLGAELLRVQFDFFFPQQLKAYEQYPLRLMTAYSLFLAGNILLWPAVLTVAKLVGQKEPAWALWGGTLVMLGLFARTFHYGINHLAFQLVKVQSLPLGTKTIAESYGAFHIVSSLSAAIMFGWIILAIETYRSGVLSLAGSVGLGLMSALMLGMLKGASPVSVLATTGLSLALIPLGKDVLMNGPLLNFCIDGIIAKRISGSFAATDHRRAAPLIPLPIDHLFIIGEKNATG